MTVTSPVEIQKLKSVKKYGLETNTKIRLAGRFSFAWPRLRDVFSCPLPLEGSLHRHCV